MSFGPPKHNPLNLTINEQERKLLLSLLKDGDNIDRANYKVISHRDYKHRSAMMDDLYYKVRLLGT